MTLIVFSFSFFLPSFLPSFLPLSDNLTHFVHVTKGSQPRAMSVIQSAMQEWEQKTWAVSENAPQKQRTSHYLHNIQIN